ncbi:hypothetical protein [Natrialbaceae archaeon AArc-T1-2]|uniref:hypothetical protein n=1 Tax=Natrialbaceae archaeon AArc-T1-2 TaxID=3053904 RepID=UPI00255B1D16|nr:hypothetical protein [Natrialbaceae archaeon AArc-T1-2]WIV67093.1 hypothetical protein QQ977_15625 [Natrialbaceae archaeon AArc-T1-2]
MTRSDDEILEYLESEGAGTPKLISESTGRNNNYITTRLRKLESYGLVERPSRGFYTLSGVGEKYLEGDLDASELEPDGE